MSSTVCYGMKRHLNCKRLEIRPVQIYQGSTLQHQVYQGGKSAYRVLIGWIDLA